MRAVSSVISYFHLACDRWEEKPKSDVRYTNATDDDYEF